MKDILLIHHSGKIGGAGISLIHLIKAIDKSKYNVTVLCPATPSEMSDILKKEKCNLILTEKSPIIFNHYNGGISSTLSLRTIKNLVDVYRDQKNIKSYLIELKPDIVAVNSMTLFWIGRIAKKMNIETICFHRETYQKGILGIRSKAIKIGLSRWFDKVAFISKNDLLETGKIKSITKIIYDRVNLSQYDKYEKNACRKHLNLNKDTKYVLYLGGKSKLKGAHIILEAMKYVDENIKLVFINDEEVLRKYNYTNYKSLIQLLKAFLTGSTEKKISKIYYKNNLKNKIILKRRTPEPEILFKACDLVVFPSTKAHQSRPIYEAGASQIPILISNFEETSEFAEDLKTAFTFESKNAKDLANKINKILNSDLELSKIVKRNYEQTKRNHDLETLKNDLQDLLENYS